ncbi:hypothetical protein BKE30_07815 [Alkanindiges hydrocarboniclasticus]|uniref:DcaP-like protein n=1 Tax=Alkanindiges hydrocarboniclasticus TaxID=1907941 RepID=A0A1S8CVF1_9GAMM|nr:DcaP family trimeric outer membrane transporter [Alkanindiges hydrocarboniclasticus]ONG40056.1 hypothetical protein BKE30_07815 [Alkanindiges hydrocarboniclasticus]
MKTLTTKVPHAKALSLSVCAIMAASLCGTSHAAASDQAEIEALRQEVNALKHIVQQLSAQQHTQLAASQTAQPLASSTGPASALEVTAVSPASASLAPAQTAKAGQPMPAVPVSRNPEGWAVLPDGKTAAKVYGFIRADMLHDFKGQPTGKFSNLHTQPLDSSDPVENKTAFTAAVTRIGVDFKTPTAIGDVGGKIEGDFWGNGGTGSATFRIRHAYLTTGNWLFGQTWSPFAGQEYAAETVDFNGVTGTSIRRATQIRYTHPLNNNTSLTIAGEEDSNSDSRFPALTARLEHKLPDSKGAFALRGMLHEKRGVATSTVNGQTPNTGNTEQEKAGYGAAIGAWYQLNPANKLSGQFFHVKGDGSFNYGTGSGFSVNAATGDVYFDEYNSAQLGLTHTFNPKMRSTVALSWVDFKDSSQFAMANPGANRELKQASVNLFYKPVASIDLGSEYTYGNREVFNGNEGKQSHLNLMARYNF